MSEETVENLCHMNDIQLLKNNAISAKEFSLTEFMLPESTFGGRHNERIKVFYISDIHLIHHFDSTIQNAFFEYHILSNTEIYKAKAQIRRIVKNIFTKDFIQALIDYEGERFTPLYNCFLITHSENMAVLFCGDISSSTVITEFFYREFITRWNYTLYQDWKEKNPSERYHLNCPEIYKKSIAHRGKDIKKKNYPIFTVLGNHELIDFPTVQKAVNHYKKFFRSCRIHFLHNESYIGYRFNIVGGIGFAKYNQVYNALTLQTTTPPMTREKEICETNKFLEAYQSAMLESNSNRKPLIVLSHYPISDWLPNSITNSMCIYFNGHNHTNKCPAENIYADNQIGYKQEKIAFKSCSLGTIYNPFCGYADGYHEITSIQYSDFLRYKGTPISKTSAIDKQLAQKRTKFYMIKKSGFYGFFIINPNTGTKICNGGAIKTISYKINIDYFYNWFVEILSAYVQAMAPYRMVQEQLSSELKKLGLSGDIHGCIVDVDFYHHISIDPFSGELSFYYSPRMGVIQKYPTLQTLLTSMIQKLDYKILHYVDGELASKKQLLSRMETLNSACLELANNNSWLTQGNLAIVETEHDNGTIEKIDIKNSIYALSRYVNQLQQIFTTNILRVWDDELIEKIANLKATQSRIKPSKTQSLCENPIAQTDK